GETFMAGETVDFLGSATDPENGNLSASMRWEVLLHHNDHVHFDFFSATGPSGTFVAADHGELNWFLEVCASATDAQMLTTRVCRDLLPRTAAYTFNTSPQGLSLSVGGVTRAAPFTVETVLNSNLPVTAPAAQAGFEFASWSDGGAASHTILVTEGARTFTATYRAGLAVPFGQRRSFQAAGL